MTYTLKLTTQSGEALTFPVLPEKIQVESKGDHQTHSVIGVGEVLVLGGSGLQTITFESQFPASSAPYVTGTVQNPMDCVSFIETAQGSKLPLTLQLSGGALEISQTVGIDIFTYYEQGGDVGDIYFALTLRQWRLHQAKALTIQDDVGVEEATNTRTEPEVESNVYYTVVKGDCLWNIAKAHYGDATRWTEIYAANKDVVGANPNLIYPGQELLLP